MYKMVIAKVNAAIVISSMRSSWAITEPHTAKWKYWKSVLITCEADSTHTHTHTITFDRMPDRSVGPRC